jgi:hypothetical protein
MGKKVEIRLHDMGTSEELKTWIREVSGKTELKDDAILIQSAGKNGTRITILDKSCCQPSLFLEKSFREICKTDIEAGKSAFEHRHP